MSAAPPASRSDRDLSSSVLLAVGSLILIACIWWISQGSWSGEPDPTTQGEQHGGGAGEGLSVSKTGPQALQHDDGSSAAESSGNGEVSRPQISAGDLDLAAQEKRLTDILHEPSSKPAEMVKAMEALLRDKRLEAVGVSEMVGLLPHTTADKDLTLGLLALTQKYPNEPFGLSLIRVFDGTGDTDVHLATLRAIGAHRRFGFSDGELMRMRRASSDSMVTDEIDRLLRMR